MQTTGWCWPVAGLIPVINILHDRIYSSRDWQMCADETDWLHCSCLRSGSASEADGGGTYDAVTKDICACNVRPQGLMVEQDQVQWMNHLWQVARECPTKVQIVSTSVFASFASSDNGTLLLFPGRVSIITVNPPFLKPGESYQQLMWSTIALNSDPLLLWRCPVADRTTSTHHWWSVQSMLWNEGKKRFYCHFKMKTLWHCGFIYSIKACVLQQLRQHLITSPKPSKANVSEVIISCNIVIHVLDLKHRERIFKLHIAVNVKGC